MIGSGYIPKIHQTTCTANSKGLFAYYQYAEASFILTCRTPDGGGSGWAGLTGVKDVSLIDAAQLTNVAADKALKSQKPRAVEPGRYTTILEPRANARFLSLMMGLFNARTAEGPVGSYFSGKQPGTTKVGEKLFSDAFTIKSDIGNPDPPADTDRAGWHGGAADDLDRERRPQEPRVRSHVGETAEEGSDPDRGEPEPRDGRGRT